VLGGPHPGALWERCLQDSNVDFVISRRRILEMADELERRNVEIDWQTPNGIRASVTDQTCLEAMRRSGCRHITLAPESGSPRVLRDIVQKGKDFELDQLVQVAEDAHEMGMKVAAYFILGLPGEREDDVEQPTAYSARLARAGVDEVGFGLFIPLPGTPLWDGLGDRVDSMDLLDLLTVVDLDSSVSFSDYLDDDDLRRLRRKAYATFFLTRLRYHPRAFARTLRNVVRSRQETKTDREQGLRKTLRLSRRRG
jgi:anaerobic magnesium-protoporphyrin IX monomethyl ester cyclase